MLSGKKILIGITGTIAAYKVCELIRLFKKNNAEVKVVLTPNALNFVTKTTLETLSGNPVYLEQFDVKEFKPEHIALTEADVFLIAPASANTISKAALGVCDNLLTSTVCAFKKQIFIAPCMNTGMWENEAVQKNLETLKSRGVTVIEPETGFLACGTNGKGRLADINKIFEAVKGFLIPDRFLNGKKIVITSGGTKENIDAVRYIGNTSSGKTGKALADAVFEYGGTPVLISTVPVNTDKYKVIDVTTAGEMYEAVKTEFENAYSLIMAAAVSDYRVKNPSVQKIKKTGEPLVLELVENIDILKEMSKIKKDGQIVVGFCAESENLIANAKEKIAKKGCDYICANDISRKDIGFSSDNNEIYIIDKNTEIFKIEKTDKNTVARIITEKIYGKHKQNN